MKLQIMERLQDNNSKQDTPKYEYKMKIMWIGVISLSFINLVGIYGGYLFLTLKIKAFTLLWWLVLFIFINTSVTMGAHRLFSHRAFKCKDWLKATLIIGQTLAGEFSQFTWTRIHRQHHKYSDTDGDPHNACRGLFFSHVGWLLVNKHPEAIEKGKEIDMSDLINDPYVMFQKKYYIILFTIFSVLIPTFIPFYLWEETLWNGFFTCVVFRLAYVINLSSLGNSLAHYYGNKPYSCYIQPTENAFLSLLTMGEGWHNYHHTFPLDYRAAELGIYSYLNLTTKFIDFCTYMGWVWDRKYATPAMIKSRAIKRGDGTHFKYGNRRKNDNCVPENVAYDCNIETFHIKRKC